MLHLDLMKPANETEDQTHLIELETKISHQEIAIDELKQTVFDQHIAIEKLVKDFKRLSDRIEGIDGGHTVGPGNDKPPHY